MPDGQLQIRVQELSQSSPSALGQDQIEFLVTTNPGQPLQPLAKVASGGELSLYQSGHPGDHSPARCHPDPDLR